MIMNGERQFKFAWKVFAENLNNLNCNIDFPKKKKSKNRPTKLCNNPVPLITKNKKQFMKDN